MKTNKTKKPIMLSGIQPSNKITLGNYLGALRPYVQTADQFDMYVFIADLHAITNTFDPKQLLENRKQVVCMYYAVGLDFNKVKIFYQSAVKSHNDLAHVLLCHTTLGELNRMTQFKDKSQKAVGNGTTMIPTGLLTYPVLMAADILLYDANAVIVGADQKQHMELTRNIAQRMNEKYKKQLFVIPEPYILKDGAKIMDLQDPSIKMSKSNKNENGTLFLLDPIETIVKKIKKAKTDSLNKVKYDVTNQPGISNLINIYCALTGSTIEQVEEQFKDIENYGKFKEAVIKVVCDECNRIQAKYKEAVAIYDSQLAPILEKNAKDCSKIVQAKTSEVYKAIGLK